MVEFVPAAMKRAHDDRRVRFACLIAQCDSLKRNKNDCVHAVKEDYSESYKKEDALHGQAVRDLREYLQG